MSSGYWKHKGAQQKFRADQHDARIIRLLEHNGWKMIRSSTKHEDMVEKWDYLMESPDAVEERVDFKTGCGVQDSHRRAREDGSLRVTKYAQFNPRHGKLNMRSVEDFWNDPNLTRRTNGHGQVYWCCCTNH